MIEQIESFFNSVELPKKPVQLYPGVMIADPNKFVSSHINIIKYSKSKIMYSTHLQRLRDFKEIILKLQA